jgi:hypothetical protein
MGDASRLLLARLQAVVGGTRLTDRASRHRGFDSSLHPRGRQTWNAQWQREAAMLDQPTTIVASMTGCASNLNPL